MAELAVSSAIEKLLPLLKEGAKELLPLLKEEVNMLMGVPKEFEEIKDLLERIQKFLKDADRKAAVEDDSTNDGIKKWVKLLREEAFRIEDVFDEYMIYVGQNPRDPRCEALVCDIVHFIQTLIPRHRIACEIRGIKSSILRIEKRGADFKLQIQPCFEAGSNNSTIECNSVKPLGPRMDYLYIEEDQLVGIEAPKDELIGWLVEGRTERTVISVVGLGGLGKSSIAKKVFDNQKVIEHFNCHAWFSVSQSYKVEVLLRDMLEKFCKEKGEDPPPDIRKMEVDSLIEQVRSYLNQKRYIFFFDDVWNTNFWDDIKSAMIDNKNGCRILITTRNMNVSGFCKESSLVREYVLKPLSPEKSLELFYKKAFRSDFDGRCPKELIDISSKIVAKCRGLPLAIVAIGGLLASKRNKSAFEWTKFNLSLSSELKMEPRLTVIPKILSLSYDDLPNYLKPCLLYFGIYPEDYLVKSKRLIRQWVAEGFVANEEGKTLEDVGEQYLSDLISRNLVQVSSFTLDGKAAGCRVHDLLHDMIRKKIRI